MLVIDNLAQVASQIESERGITKETLIEAIEQALVSACRKRFSEDAILEATLDIESGVAKMWRKYLIVKKIENKEVEIALKDAKKKNPDAKIDEYIVEECELADFGRIAAQTAKQVIIQRIREAEKDSVFEEFKKKEGEIITGTVQRIENRNYLINLGRIEAFLRPADQIPGEILSVKDRVKLFIVGVEKMAKGPQIHISRTHPGLLKALFEIEVPEVQDGIIEIVSVSRDPGKRAKVAVKSNNVAIGAVGTCVGHMGSRIQSIIRELGNEKIDILEFNEDPSIYIANSLKPAKIKDVMIPNKENKEAVVIVPKDQLSLAIGKMGINVRLAVNLTGWKIDILSSDEYEAKADDIMGAQKLSIVDKIKRDAALMKQEEEKAKEKKSEIENSEIQNEQATNDKRDSENQENELEDKVIKKETKEATAMKEEKNNLEQ